ncbi:unnamed protein product [Moneuplotes crassus]|uniref:RING-type domain-containing protein n=1 Tax=Euplotes crassus TaxID=5936 RepID=A0AAD1UNZ9_EUPCR|nr:unnamed protein product [Moneuplotes crassus]
MEVEENQNQQQEEVRAEEDNHNWVTDFQNYRKNFFKNLCCSMTGFVAMVVCIIIAGSGTCGGNTKAVVYAALIIKFTFAVPIEILYMFLIYKRICKSTNIGLIKLILMFLFLSWYIYIIVSFFSSDNDCHDQQRALYVAHFILLIESFLMLLFVTFLSILICCVIICLCRHQQLKKKENRKNRRLKDVLLNAVNLQLNLDDLNEDDQCAICLEEFNEDDNILRLPCDQRHHFHSTCIGDWCSRKATCPLCKVEFDKDKIKSVKVGSLNS